MTGRSPAGSTPSLRRWSRPSGVGCEGVPVSRESTREYFEWIAPVWDYWHRKNGFYHRKMTDLIRGMVTPGASVLELGCGTGDLLAALRPAAAIGLNVAEGMTALARKKHPEFQFETVEVDQAKIPNGFTPDYV